MRRNTRVHCLFRNVVYLNCPAKAVLSLEINSTVMQKLKESILEVFYVAF